MRKQNILVTGLSGVVGSAVITHLKDKYHLTALNRSDIPGMPCHRADIANLEAIKPVFYGQDAVVHLAAFLGDTSWETTLSTNIIGTYNVFEAARQAKVRHQSERARLFLFTHSGPRFGIEMCLQIFHRLSIAEEARFSTITLMT